VQVAAELDVRARHAEPPIDRTGPSGSVGLVLLLALAFVGAAVGLSLLEGEQAQPYVLVLLAVLAVVGIFALFAGAVGILQFAGRAARDDLGRAILASAEEGVSVVDPEGRIVFANEAYLRLTNAESPRLARTVERAFAGDPGVHEAMYRLSQAAREGKPAQEEVRIAGPAGARWLRIGVRALPSARAGDKRALWTVTDKTRERERQENVFIELQHAIDFLDHAPAGFFSATADGRLVYMNATLAGWLDHDLTRIASGGLTLREIVAGDGASLLEALVPAPGEAKTELLDVDLKSRGGQSVPVRLLHRVAYAADGTPAASRTLVLDRRPGENAGEDLRAAEVRFARFFNNSPIAIATIDGAGTVARTNGPFARLFAEALKAEPNRSLPALVAERDRPALERTIAQAASGTGDLPPVDAGLAGGGSRSARFYVSGVEAAENDQHEAAIIYALDMTEQRQLEAQFAQSQKMQAIGQLAGGVAHDFNNVLTAIIGFSDLLLANHRPTDPHFGDIMQIKQNANRAAGLVRQLLAFSRRQTLRPQVLALGDVLSELRILLSRLLGERVSLELVHGRDLWLVKADLNQFEQVIVNLAVNARDAMPDGGRLTIRTSNLSEEQSARFGYPGFMQGDYVLIEVEDTGSGMPPEIIDKIFDPFFSTKEVGKGTGLGLSTVYGIVKQTGGYIFVDSIVGKGSTFRVFLPRHVQEPVVEAKPVAVAAPAADLTGKGTVLLVEDEDAVRAFAARALVSRGFTVLEANSGVDALRVLDEHDGEVQLVVSDVVMPEMDGPSLLKELRRRNPDAKVIFVSGYAEEAFKKNLAEEEKFVFLPKPFTLKQLVEAVKETLAAE
jgi:two-component system cell cycle sensor histidine kinase/response regulator CckA